MSETLVYEGDVAEQLGLSRKDVARIRRELALVEEVDWCNGPHRRLMLTPVGFQKIVAAVESSRKAEEGAEAVETEEESENLSAAREGVETGQDGEKMSPKPMPMIPELKVPKKLEARVKRVPKFPKLLECVIEGKDRRRMLVKVQDNKNFVEGMVVPIREAVGQGPGVYYYDGALPKRKGFLPKR